MCTVYHYSIQYAKRLGHILISDHVVTNLFMHSLPVIILLYMDALFYTKGVLACFILHQLQSGYPLQELHT